MLPRLKKLMQKGILSPIAYHFARYIDKKHSNDAVTLAAALVSWQHQQGHVCINLQDYAARLLFTSEDFAGIQTPVFTEWLEELEQHPWVTSQFPAPLIIEKQRLYLGKYWQFETQLANTIQQRLLIPNTALNIAVLKQGLQRLFPSQISQHFSDIDWQAVAAVTALLNHFVVISGGPGTGKTSTVIRILSLLLAQNAAIKIEMVAPTGKAAARLAESIRTGKQESTLYQLNEAEKELIPESAKTIHRLLGYSPQGFRYHRHQQRPLDVLIIDEASMVDLPLMSRLLEAIPSHARIILLGDKDQLASVEAGSVLSDITGQQKEHYYQADFIEQLQQIGIVETGVIPVSAIALPKVASGIALLRKSYRFDDQSGIGQAARMINLKQGKAAFRQVFQSDQYSDVRWLNHQNETLHPDSLDWAVEQYSHYLHCSQVEDALLLFEQFRILTALRAGEFGVETINQRMIQLLYQRGLIQAYDEFQGKPIMITCNDYELDLFNGDIGLLWKEPESQRLYAYFTSLTGTLRQLPIRQLPEHETAFALTIHKSQGSEFKNLLLILPLENHRVLSKELIYTGVTRAKQQLMLAGDENSFIQACNKTIKRQSGLAEKLGW